MSAVLSMTVPLVHHCSSNKLEGVLTYISSLQWQPTQACLGQGTWKLCAYQSVIHCHVVTALWLGPITPLQVLDRHTLHVSPCCVSQGKSSMRAGHLALLPPLGANYIRKAFSGYGILPFRL